MSVSDLLRARGALFPVNAATAGSPAWDLGRMFGLSLSSGHSRYADIDGGIGLLRALRVPVSPPPPRAAEGRGHAR